MNWKKQRFIDCVERSEDTYIIFCDSLGCGEIAAQKIGSEKKKVYLVRKGGMNLLNAVMVNTL